MFNAVLYVLCIIHEALNQTKVKHDEMSSNWEDMEQQLRVAKAKAAMEKRLREESLSTVEAEREELQHLAASLKDEMTIVRRENQARFTLSWDPVAAVRCFVCGVGSSGVLAQSCHTADNSRAPLLSVCRVWQLHLSVKWNHSITR